MQFLKNEKLIKSSFVLCVLLFFFSFVYSCFMHYAKIQVPMLGKTYSPIVINVEIPEYMASDIAFYADGRELDAQIFYKDNPYIFYEADFPADTIYFKVKNSSVLNSIDNICLNMGKNFYYYNREDISKFKKTFDGNYYLPPDIHYAKGGAYTNDKGPINAFGVEVLSFFYNTNFYTLSFVFGFLAVLIYINNKDKFKGLKISSKMGVLLLIILLGFILRLTDIIIPFWGDELYTSTVASGADLPFLNTYQDPGNPPLFFILAKFWMMIFGSSEVTSRLLPCLFSVLTIWAVYLFVKNNFKEKPAFLASFLFCINAYSIHSAKEFRCYSLGIFLSVLLAYFLFKIIKEGKNKDLIFYAILASLAANVHYFQIIFLINNFIFGMFCLNKTQRIKFFWANVIAALAFLPYFIYTGLNKGLLDETFNVMPLYDFTNNLFILITYFSNFVVPAVIFILFGLILFKKVREFFFYENKQIFNLYIYCTYSILAFFVTSNLFSYLIKPIVKIYYFVYIIPFISILLALVFFLPFKNRILKILTCAVILFNGVFCFSGRGVYVDKDDMLVIRAEELIKYSYFDSLKFIKQNKKIDMAVFHEGKRYAAYYKNFYRKDKISVFEYQFGGDNILKLCERIKNSNSDVTYTIFHKASAVDCAKLFGEKFKTALIKTDRDVFIARVEKK